jgi:hypothetical protein
MAKFIPKAQKAERVKLKASILVDALSGNGKSGFALQAAYYLGGEDFSKIGAVDTENNSLPLYIGKKMPDGTKYETFTYYPLDKYSGFTPSYYLACRQDAVRNYGCKAFINDSLSHAWSGKDGVLDLVSQANAAQKTYAKNFTGWNDPTVIEEKTNLIEMVRSRDCHVISTGRVKKEYAIESVVDESTGKVRTNIEAKGLGIIQESTLEYEPDLVVRLIQPGSETSYPIGEITKSRYDMFIRGETYEFTPKVWRDLRAWLEEGADADKIFEEQRQDYIRDCKQILDTNSMKRPIWQVKKEDLGYKDVKLEDLPLDALKLLYAVII